VNILICGWYGTETLGDRAILAGILKILGNTFQKGDVNVKIASLYPFLTKRTLIEDRNIYVSIAPGLNLTYFDVNNLGVLDREINATDLVVFGGGPIMDLMELEVIKYIFIKANKNRKPTAILGCGLGPLYRKQFKNTAKEILKHSNLVIFRDKKSVESSKELLKDPMIQFNYSHDPAILAGYQYKLHKQETRGTLKNYIAVNVRQFQNIGFRADKYVSETKIIELLEDVSKKYGMVKLIPMHTYGIGGDDRYYLTKLQNETKSENIEVVHKPMNLYQLFDIYSEAEACIGMRYHSVVFQTLLNGNNYILDYTDKKNGKISAFIKLFDTTNFYGDRYINVLEDTPSDKFLEIKEVLERNKHFNFESYIYEETLDKYVKLLKSIT